MPAYTVMIVAARKIAVDYSYPVGDIFMQAGKRCKQYERYIVEGDVGDEAEQY